MIEALVAIDLGATNLRVAAIKENLDIIKVSRERTVKDDKEALYAQIKRMVSEVTEDIKFKFIGISACGFTSYNNLDVLPNLHIKNLDLSTRLERDFPGCKVRLANDANCTCLIEALKGAAKDDDTTYFITISSGIGAGLVVDKKLVDRPFELGHNYLSYKGETYELEYLCSGNGIVNLCRINGVTVENAYEFFTRVKDKDEAILPIYQDWINLLSIQIANIYLLYNPDSIVLSGGCMKSIDIFYDDLYKRSSELISRYPLKKLVLKNAQFDQDAGLMGATSQALALLNESRE